MSACLLLLVIENAIHSPNQRLRSELSQRIEKTRDGMSWSRTQCGEQDVNGGVRFDTSKSCDSQAIAIRGKREEVLPGAANAESCRRREAGRRRWRGKP